MEDETIEAAPSEENGNVVDEELTEETVNEITEEAPSETVETETPAETVEEPTPTEPELYELPDGRKVDAETLSKEWKENFYPEYTRKSQELAQAKAPITETKPTNPLEDPEYVPQTYAELAQKIKEDTLRELEEKQNAVVQARKNIEDNVSAQLTEIKIADPTLNESALFQHATKYKFADLKMAHANMKDMNATIKKVQTQTAENIAKRSDPVSVTPGAAGGQRPDPSQFGSSIEYLRSLK